MKKIVEIITPNELLKIRGGEEQPGGGAPVLKDGEIN